MLDPRRVINMLAFRQNHDKVCPMKESDVIVCPVSSWFRHRVLMLVALVAGLGGYFLYDGCFGYPGKNYVADLHDSYEAGRNGGPIPVSKPSESSKQRREELERAHKAGSEGGTWAAFAADRMLSDKKPKRYTASEIREQFVFASLMGVLALVIGGFGMRAWRKSLRGGADVVVFPNGERVDFSRIQSIDIERWDRGLGFVLYHDSEGRKRKRRVDDYKYQGAARILRQILSKNPNITLEGDPRWLEEVRITNEDNGG